jgi:hypothetical protein
MIWIFLNTAMTAHAICPVRGARGERGNYAKTDP